MDSIRDKKGCFYANEFAVLVYRMALMLLIYAFLRISFWLLNTELFPVVTSDRIYSMLWSGLRFDISALAYLNALYFAVFICGLWWKTSEAYQRLTNAIFYLFNGLGIVLNCIDFVYYRYILKRTTANVFDILKNEDNWLELTVQIVADYWWIIFMIAVFVAFMVVATRSVRPSLTPVRNRLLYVLMSSMVLSVVGALTVAGMRGGFRHSTRPITLSNAAAYVDSPEESWIVLNTPFCIIRTIGKKSFVRYDYFAQEESEQIFSPYHEANSLVCPYDNVASARKNVVIFILESFSREFLGRFNGDLEHGRYEGYTPFLDSLANKSLIFTNAFANGRKSIDAMPSVLASIPSLTMPYVVSEYSNNKINGIASLLGSEGYHTAFFHGAPNGSMGFDAFARLAGFESYVGKNEYANNDDFDGIWGIWDDKFMSFFADRLSVMNQPFCTALFSLSSHHPYKVPQEYEGHFKKGPLPLEECIGYTDNSLKLFFEKAAREPWFENTLFVITADHSITPEHAEYNNNAQAFAIPILFYAPSDSTLAGEDLRLAQQADIMPTILAFLGFKKPFLSFGVNLFDNDQERFVVNYLNGVYQIYMDNMIAYFDGINLTGVYDMSSDSSLSCNLLGKVDVGRIEKKIKAYVQQYNSRMIDNRLTAEY